MSTAESRLELESPTRERFNPFEPVSHEVRSDGGEAVVKNALEHLASISPPVSAGPVIAIDLDDVLSQTNREVALCKPVDLLPYIVDRCNFIPFDAISFKL